MTQENNSKHIEWLLAAKGIAIILVVIGHFHPNESPGYWSLLNGIIYSFHMPLFFTLSGYLFFQEKYSYKELVISKSKRLLFPYFSTAGILLITKLISDHFAHLEHPVNTQSIYSLLTNPVHSYAPLLWFMHALFLIFLTYPLLTKALNDYALLAILIITNTLTGCDYFFLEKAAYNAPFFITGILIRRGDYLKIAYKNTTPLTLIISASIFIAVYAITEIINTPTQARYLVDFFLGTSGTLLTISLSQRLSNTSSLSKSILIQCGTYSMGIYLFHTIFESFARISLKKIVYFHSFNFESVAFLSIFFGIFAPLLLEKYILRKYPLTRKYILGMR